MAQLGSSQVYGELQVTKNITTNESLTIKSTQKTTTPFSKAALKVSAPTVVDSGGHTTLALSTSPVDNWGISLNAVRESTGGYPTFKIKTHESSDVGTDRLVIKNDGKVGVGCSTPAALLHLVMPLDNAVPAFSIGESGSTKRLSIYQETSYAGNRFDSVNTDLKFSTYTAGGTGGNIIFYTHTTASPTESIRINSTGDLLLAKGAIELKEITAPTTIATDAGKLYATAIGTTTSARLAFKDNIGTVTTLPKINYSTSDPSGGVDGDIWFKYTA